MTEMTEIMKVHHIGYLIDDIEGAAREFERLGFSRRGQIVEDVSRAVFILFLDNNGCVVELIEPMDENSPVYGLRKKYRNSPSHICYETTDLQGKIAEMTDTAKGGYTLIQAPQPAPAIHGCSEVAFLLNRSIGMIELVEVK
jgi:methylmalonyl-CoA/ethylmalonyl-CoA epimerase